jgi:ADP-ribosylglycohydrolase
MSEIYSRILGALLGVAAGDAMGMPTEMWSQKRIKNRFGKVSEFLPGPPDNEISAGLAAGETTDDTIVTVLVAETLLECNGRPDAIKIVEKIEKWAQNNPKSKTVIGPSTRRAFALIANGTPVEEAGRSGDTNGAAMRISPVGMIADWRDLPGLVDLVSQVCLPTHNTGTAISGAAAVAAAVSCAIDGEASLDVITAAAVDAARLGSQRGYDVCGASVPERLLFAVELAKHRFSDEEFLYQLYSLVGTGLPANETVPSAFALMYRAGGDVMTCARLCANVGGDTDTLGAIACGICGALGGEKAVPAEISEMLQRVNGYDFAVLAEHLTELRQKYRSDHQ